MTTIVPLTDALDAVSVTAGSDDADKVETLLDAVSAEMRGLARRAFEGSPTIYRETYEPEARTLVLPHVPVTDVLWLRPVAWDHTATEIWTPLEVTGGLDTTLAAAASAGDENLKLTDVTDLTAGDHLRLGSGTSREVVRITSVGTAGAGGEGVGIEPALSAAQALAASVREVADSTYWRLMSAARGRLELAYARRLVEVCYRVSGEIPDHVTEAALDWIVARWATSDAQLAGLESYRTGHDAETYDTERVAGTPPRSVLRALGLTRHMKGAVV